MCTWRQKNNIMSLVNITMPEACAVQLLPLCEWHQCFLKEGIFLLEGCVRYSTTLHCSEGTWGQVGRPCKWLCCVLYVQLHILSADKCKHNQHIKKRLLQFSKCFHNKYCLWKTNYVTLSAHGMHAPTQNKHQHTHTEVHTWSHLHKSLAVLRCASV